MLVREIMTSNIEMIPPTTSVRNAAIHMAKCEVGALPIGVENVAQGIVTDRDIVVRAIATGEDPDETPISSIMTTHIVSITDDQDVNEAMRLMDANRVGQLIVMNVSGELCGIVSLCELKRHIETLTKRGSILESVSATAKAAAVRSAGLTAPQ